MYGPRRWRPPRAPAPAVFAAFSELEEREVVGSAGLHDSDVDFDPRVEAAYRIEMQPSEGESFDLIGEFRAVDPTTRLGHAVQGTGLDWRSAR